MHKWIVSRMAVRQGYKIPKMWGIAYYVPDKDIAIVLPIPLNWIVGLARQFWFTLVRGPNPTKYEKAIWDAEARGASRAYAEIRSHEERMSEIYHNAFKEALKEYFANRGKPTPP